MTPQHVLVIDGSTGSALSLARGHLLSTQALHEYSTILWVVDGLTAEMSAYTTQQAAMLDQSLLRRLLQIQEWVQEGHNLILVGPSATAIYHKAANGAYLSASVQMYFPMGLVEKTLATGTKLEAVPGFAASAVFDPFLKDMSYRATLVGEGLIPLLFAQRATAGEKIIVGGYLNEGKGKVFFVPTALISSDKTDNFYRALVRLPDCVGVNREDLPQWTSSFRSADENEIVVRVADLTGKRQEIDRLIAEQTAKLAEGETLKHLISGTGAGFSLAVSKGLGEIGFNLTDGPNSRADFIGTCANRYVAIEAKGIDGSVRERQYRQVERWMAELNNALHSEPEDIKGDPEIAKYAECVSKVALPSYDGSDAKGLLVVGTFRQTPLNQRAESDFPDTVARLLQRTDTCGMTGVQLFGLVMAARKDAMMKAVIQKEIIETRGILLRCRGWTEFLTKVD
jgi:hypothetical protein